MEPEPELHMLYNCELHSQYHYTNYVTSKETVVQKHKSKYCDACKIGEINRISHMYPGGCLYSEKPKIN